LLENLEEQIKISPQKKEDENILFGELNTSRKTYVPELESPEKNRPSVEVTPRKDPQASPLKSKLQKEHVVMSSNSTSKA
jgi:hypothetical protein